MKLVSYRHAGGESYGAVQGNGVVDLGARLGDSYADLKAALAAGALDELRGVAEGQDAGVALSDVEYLMPITSPGKIFCIGRNYRAYHEVLEDGRPDWPSIFPRFTDSFSAHNQPIIVNSDDGDQLDYEGELVVVIGKTARHIAEADSMSHVAGYTIANEGSVRNWIGRGTQNCPVKNHWRSGSMGPWMVTADEIADPNKLHITTTVSGEKRQDGGTDMMIFDIPFVISHISTFTWLEPGDMIATGSPGGSAIESDPPAWLRPGQEIEIEIAPIGVLRNRIEAEAS